MEGNIDNEDARESKLAISQAKKRRTEKEANEGREMKRLEDALFGSLYSPIEFGNKEEESTIDDEAENPSSSSSMFFVDRSANSELSIYKEDLETTNEESDVEEGKAVWVDEEEERTTVNIARVNRLRKRRKEEEETIITGREYISGLRAHHAKLNRGTECAQLGLQSKNNGYEDSSDEENGIVKANGYEDVEAFDDVFRSDRDLVVKKSKSKLLPGLLEYSRLVDANVQDPSNGPINSVQFHRNSQLLLTAGLDRRLLDSFKLMARGIQKYKASSSMIAPFVKQLSPLIDSHI